MPLPKDSILTDYQREVLNAALDSREHKEPATPSSRPVEDIQVLKSIVHPSIVASKQERRSHTPRTGRPKKGGAGGKGTWGNPLIPYTEFGKADPADPNYDSDEDPYELVEAPMADAVQEYKGKVVALIHEYFTTGDVSEAAASLKDLHSTSFHHCFVKKLVSSALDRHDREKEMAASLLSSLYGDLISREQMAKGFSKLVEAADDFVLDCPQAVEVLTLFVARAVVDDILPPAFLSKTAQALGENEGNGEGLAVVRAAEVIMATPHHAERVERAWGGASQTTVAGAKERIASVLREYGGSGDMDEACKGIRDLNLPFFHHEVVKKALTAAMDDKKTEKLMLALLKETSVEGLISVNQMAKGFGRMAEAVDDLSLDIPNANQLLDQYATRATQEGWLSVNSSGSAEEEPEMESKTVRDFKRSSVEIVVEYFSSGDTSEVGRSLSELDHPDLAHLAVKKVITLAMDRHSKEKEMASLLLSELYPDVFPGDQIEAAFNNLLVSIEDLALDIPEAPNELALFIARAVTDDIVAPLYLSEACRAFGKDRLGGEVVQMAQTMMGARHAGERILRCWGGGAGRSVEESKAKMSRVLEEYEAGGDLQEACESIRGLNMPFFHHEVVKKVLIMAMEKSSPRPLHLLHECSTEGLISTSQMSRGFDRVRDQLPDLKLDILNAPHQLDVFSEQARNEGWLKTEKKEKGQSEGVPETESDQAQNEDWVKVEAHEAQNEPDTDAATNFDVKVVSELMEMNGL